MLFRTGKSAAPIPSFDCSCFQSLCAEDTQETRRVQNSGTCHFKRNPFWDVFFFIVRWCKVIFFEWCLLLLLTQIRPSFTFLFTSQLRCQARENSSSKAMMLMWSGCKFGNRKFSTLSPWRCGSSRRNLSLSSREIPGIVYPVYPAYPLRLPHQGGGRLCRP